MTDLDARLTDALRADAPPERDPVFRLDVLVRLERVRFRRRLAATLTLACAAGVLVAMNARAIEAWMAVDIWRAWIVAAVAFAAVFALPGFPIEATPGVRTAVRAIGRWFAWQG
jgi:hypothetical protein